MTRDKDIDNILGEVILPTEEQIKVETKNLKISLANTGKPGNRNGVKASDETKAKMSAALKGRSGVNIGIPRTQELKDKVSQSLIGRKRPKEVMDKIGAKLRGRHLSEEHKKACSESLKGREFTLETIRKKNKYYFLSPKGRFESLQELIAAFSEIEEKRLHYIVRNSKDGFSKHLKIPNEL